MNLPLPLAPIDISGSLFHWNHFPVSSPTISSYTVSALATQWFPQTHSNVSYLYAFSQAVASIQSAFFLPFIPISSAWLLLICQNPVVPSLGSPPWTPPHSSVGLSLCSCSIDQNCIIVCYESLETWLFPSLHWECFKNRDHDLFIFAHQVPKAWYFTLHSTKYTWQVFPYFRKYFLKKCFALTLSSQPSLLPCSLTLNLFSATSSPLRLSLWWHGWVESLVLDLHSLPSPEHLLYDAQT